MHHSFSRLLLFGLLWVLLPGIQRRAALLPALSLDHASNDDTEIASSIYDKAIQEVSLAQGVAARQPVLSQPAHSGAAEDMPFTPLSASQQGHSAGLKLGAPELRLLLPLVPALLEVARHCVPPSLLEVCLARLLRLHQPFIPVLLVSGCRGIMAR